MAHFPAEALLALIAMVLGGFACWDYFRSGRAWTLRAKIWIRIALFIAAVTALLLVWN